MPRNGLLLRVFLRMHGTCSGRWNARHGESISCRLIGDFPGPSRSPVPVQNNQGLWHVVKPPDHSWRQCYWLSMRMVSPVIITGMILQTGVCDGIHTHHPLAGLSGQQARGDVRPCSRTSVSSCFWHAAPKPVKWSPITRLSASEASWSATAWCGYGGSVPEQRWVVYPQSCRFSLVDETSVLPPCHLESGMHGVCNNGQNVSLESECQSHLRPFNAGFI